MSASPWQPRIGDRVRVRTGVGRSTECAELPHYPEEQGHTGVVIGDRARPVAPSHRFLVAFDRPGPLVRMGSAGLMPLSVRHYAADELEPVV
jgi:hypothetical protein